jgi:preprotein translocase subunit YajC
MKMDALLALAQEAPGAATPPPGGGLLVSLLPFILIFVIFYFLLILPQQRQKKKHREMLAALKKGDRVVTSSGFLGTVANIHKEVVTLQVADNVKIKVLKDSIANLQAGEEEGS